jgi:hypothetical protein
MSNISEIVAQVNGAINEPFSWDELEKAMLAISAKLAEPKWAIEDEALRTEMENLLVQIAAHSYLRDRGQSGSEEE